MKTWHGILAASAVALSGWWVKHRLATDAAELDELRGSMTTLSRSVDDADRAARTRAAVAGRVRTADGRDARVTIVAPPAPAPLAKESAAPDETAPTPGVDPATARVHLDTRFAHQDADSSWSAGANQQVEHSLAALMPPSSTLNSVECKATMCRIEMTYTDLAQYQAFLKHVTPDSLPWNGALFATTAADGPTDGPMTFVAFFAREGEPLTIE